MMRMTSEERRAMIAGWGSDDENDNKAEGAAVVKDEVADSVLRQGEIKTEEDPEKKHQATEKEP